MQRWKRVKTTLEGFCNEEHSDIFCGYKIKDNYLRFTHFLGTVSLESLY